MKSGVLVGSAIVLGGLGGYAYLGSQAKKFAAQMDVLPYSIGADGIKLKVKLKISNPTNVPFKIVTPVFNVFYGADLLGSSTPDGKLWSIPANGRLELPEITIDITLTTGLFFVIQLIQSIVTKQSFTLTVNTSIKLKALGFVPFSTTATKNITIVNPKKLNGSNS